MLVTSSKKNNSDPSSYGWEGCERKTGQCPHTLCIPVRVNTCSCWILLATWQMCRWEKEEINREHMVSMLHIFLFIASNYLFPVTDMLGHISAPAGKWTWLLRGPLLPPSDQVRNFSLKRQVLFPVINKKGNRWIRFLPQSPQRLQSVILTQYQFRGSGASRDQKHHFLTLNSEKWCAVISWVMVD